MIKRIELSNFRGFKDHKVSLTVFALLIGQNNAGKTTLIEALRIIAIAQARAPTANFIPAPEYLSTYVTGAVYRISLAQMGFEHKTAHHRYEASEPAIITAVLNNNCRVKVFIGEEEGEVLCQLVEAGGHKVISRAQSSNIKFGRVVVMPPVGQMVVRERRLNDKYLAKSLNSQLAYRHVRNQMHENIQDFGKFAELVQNSWAALQIKMITVERDDEGSYLSLQVRDGPFVSEIGLQGSGLQAWVQTLWFLSRVDRDSVIVLDEPDVYLHADLQRKLIKILGSIGFKQVIVATHSVEMISDVGSNEIVLVRKNQSASRPIASASEAQLALDEIGTLHNLQLSKLAQSGRVLFVEGKDQSFLSAVAYKLGSEVYDRFVLIPSFPIDGCENWPRAALAANVFHNSSAGRIKSYLILDRDYRSDADFDAIKLKAERSFLTILNWTRKEIENYFIDANVIAECISDSSGVVVEADEIADLLANLVKDMEKTLPAVVGESLRATKKGLDLPTYMSLADELIGSRRQEGARTVDMLSGKKLLSTLSDLCKTRYKVSFSPVTLCRAMKAHQVPKEMRRCIEDLCGIKN